MVMKKIPQDIIDYIIREFIDAGTLRTCTLVAHSFRYPAQKRRFSSITIALTPYLEDDYRIKNLYYILKVNPTLGEHVQELHLLFHAEFYIADLYDVLRMTLQPRRLYLRPLNKFGLVSIEPVTHIWPEIDHLISSPHLEEIDIKHLNQFPLYTLVYGTRIRHLTVIHASFDNQHPDFTQTGVPAHLDLESLSFSPASHISYFLKSLSPLVPLTSLSSLRKFKLHSVESDEDAINCQTIVDLSARSLEDLTINIGPLNVPRFQVVNVTLAEQLRYIRLSLEGRKQDLIDWLQRFLQASIPTVNRLEKLTLDIRPSNVDQESWNTLDHILFDASCHSDTHININLLKELPPSPVIHPSSIQEFMPLLTKRKRFSISSEEQSSKLLAALTLIGPPSGI